ncbi:chemotaxis protein CheB [Rubritalea profundi]|nr:chemotaxis protein CheB [Rubritalea profundi]
MTQKKHNNPKTPTNPMPARPSGAVDTPAPSLADKESGQSDDQPLGDNFPIVGIGASAGGLAAFEDFFAGMPTKIAPGMAFILVQHLAPDHKSLLSDLVQRYTRMDVFEVNDGMVVRPNCVYIIPPGRDMAFLNGSLQLLEPSAPHGQRLPIDFFFRSLAQDLHERAIGIVLSGTGSDGSQGVRAIKGEGGIVMAQKITSCQFDGMPSSALATGLVDFELSPAEMPEKLIAYANHAFSIGTRVDNVEKSTDENVMKKIFILLRTQTGHDFSQYKPNTVYRRIERRMAVHQITLLEYYVKYLQQNPSEVESLFRDLLIGVTSFFRDPEAFQALQDQAIPKLFESKPVGGSIRVWCPGCSTGEEPYSIAILLLEEVEKLKKNYSIQVFATDIDNQAIKTARAGLYPASIAADISPERLARYFTEEQEGRGYRIHKRVRDLLIFSEQNVIKDPPFSKLDLVSCRNLLIYLNAELQKKLIPLFHYALQPAGMLFLGTSEGVGEFGDLFGVTDRKFRVFERKEGSHLIRHLSVDRTHPLHMLQAGQTSVDMSRPLSRQQSLRKVTEQALLQEVTPVAALVDHRGDLLYLHGRAGSFLEPSPGEAGTSNILKMAREGLHTNLSAILRNAVHSKKLVSKLGLRLKTHGHFIMVNLTVRPVTTGPIASTEAPLYLVIMQEAPLPDPPADVPTDEPGSADDIDPRILALQHELRAKDEYLQSTHEELEITNQDLKSSNEEMQSVNEELQSTIEELETSKEELQSVNEELATVNAELQSKVVDLSRLNNDMKNLLDGTGIASIFVDHRLRILRFTPTAIGIMNLIPGDVGRPMGDIVANLIGYDSLEKDTQAVLDSLKPREVEVQTVAGAWFMMRVIPYRSFENMIEGAVVSFIDITEMVQTREALKKANYQLRSAVIVRDASDAISMQDLEGHILAWNPAAEQLYGWSEAEALQMNVYDRIPQELQEDALARLRQLSQSKILKPHKTQRLNKEGMIVEVTIVSTALIDEGGEMYAISTTERARAAVHKQLPRSTP